ncbi:MAG: FAD-dependent oxidoreductase, partial [Demequinaceae bacterium]|nr:FAD-dependent oxidoreductase [Demequinaceae bacterium]
MTSSAGGEWVVIGGGIAGLLAARRLAGEGRSVTLLERGDALGGRVSGIDVAGLTLDAGAESFATRGDAVERLCVELGLGDRVVQPSSSPAWVIS